MIIHKSFSMTKKTNHKKTLRKKKPRIKLSPEEKAKRREQKNQENEIRRILKNIGFYRLPHIDGKEFIFNDRTSEMDDIFINENVIVITEYTIGDPGNHLLKKKIFYDKINEDKREFIDFLLSCEKLNSFRKYYDENINGNYAISQLKLQVIYCSKKTISEEHKKLVDNVIFFDHHIVQYFKGLTKVIKMSSKYEFLDFLKIPFNDFGENIQSSSMDDTNKFSGHILPETKSSFKEGYKIVSFYIDAESLIKRSYVLRQNGWRDAKNVGHYQRMLETRKINGMRKYLTEKKRVFINNIISTISVDDIKLYDKDNKPLILNSKGQFIDNDSNHVTPTAIEIYDRCNIIGLIDGQHRTYAYHEGDDQYEKEISKIRKVQNLLITGILFPQDESEKLRLEFEANLFLEINSNQTKVRSRLTQEIELMINPFSSIAIGKKILNGLNKSGPLSNLIEQYDYEKGKIKTASIVSFALKPLVKLEDVKASDSIFAIWSNQDKHKLKVKNNKEFELLDEYVEFSVEKIRDLLIGFKANLSKEKWSTYSPATKNGLLTVTTINGILNVLRLLIENKKVVSSKEYIQLLKGIDDYDLKRFKSSQYRKLGEDIYKKFFE